MHLWREEFVRFDAGRLFVRRDMAVEFNRRGWRNAEAILLSPQFQYARYRRYFGGWDTGTGRLQTAGCDPDLHCHIKRFRRGFRGRSIAFREADKVGLFQSAGIPCLDLIAVGRMRVGTAAHPFRSCLITERVGTGESLAERIVALPKHTPAGARQRLDLLAAAARLIARMHTAGIFHGDCKLLHVIFDSGQSGETSLRFIDLERARRLRGPAAAYAWIKDLDQLDRSLRVIDAAPEEIANWYDAYDRACISAGGALAAWRDMRGLALSLRRKLNRLRKPLVRAVQPNRRQTVRRGEHPLHAEKLRYRATMAGQ